ncbi:MAG: hypothetical protein NTZ09_10795 [Candidatus Hydrogenedentes bacterium]|nr:hypothetical protein [Candidatus Hydrogenedentota bacterium]
MQSDSSSGSTDSGAAGSEGAAPVATAAPALDANSLTNSVWSMKVDKVTLTVTFLPGGALQAKSPLLAALVGTDTVGGTWSVSGANLSIMAQAGDKQVSETAVISGDQILVRGTPAKRIQ